jgi:ubiquinone/menaquinone biosynthesis C-methylase UbiE
MTVLDAGCGLGDDAFRMAELVIPGGRVVGLDSSAVMIGKARSDELSGHLPVEFRTGDIRALPFADRSFSRCRVDRVLQHVPRPEEAVSELMRVLEPGGLLLAYDNDWGTFTVASKDRETTRSLETFWCDSFTNSWIGRDLAGLFMSSGLSGVEIYPSTCVIRDFDTADGVYNLHETVRRAAAEEIISPDRGRLWLEELLDRTAQGSFLAAHTAYTVVAGKKRPPTRRR